MSFKRLCVFCGANAGFSPVYRAEAEKTGRLLAERKIELVYGAGNIGLMGAVADAALAAGGTVIGVIEAFHQLGDQSNKNAMGNVMAGIAEALVATAVGLFVAIPAVVAFNWAQKKVGDIESNVNSMTRLVAAIIRFREREDRTMPGTSYNEELAQSGEHVVIEVPHHPRLPRDLDSGDTERSGFEAAG